MLRAFYILIMISSYVIFFNHSYAQPSLDNLKFKNNVLIGEIHFRFWFWSIYDAKLYSTQKPFKFNQGFLLEITYLRNFSSQAIAKESIQQIQSQNPQLNQELLDQWQRQLEKIFPNIKEGDQLIGYYSPKGYAYFYDKNANFLGQIDSPEFSRYFFDIWLSDKSENITLSRKLRGLN
ncbi:chalcone isomerase family protein [Thiotrichales bacterium 19S3-7]|nr:chalcone isomerase family protein [Thiotrichales bacterium 19S3-7]MCF6800639.1 chalcone isomerase family protein [Thiotrichales bacterium 19S3-11]